MVESFLLIKFYKMTFIYCIELWWMGPEKIWTRYGWTGEWWI